MMWGRGSAEDKPNRKLRLGNTDRRLVSFLLAELSFHIAAQNILPFKT